jgi:tight adherence protein B
MDNIQLIILGVAGLVAVVIIVVGVIGARRENLVEERLVGIEGQTSYKPIEVPDGEEKPLVEERRELLKGVDELLTKRKFGQKWRRQLARADLKLTVAEFAALHVVSMIGGFAVGYFVIARNDIVMSIVAGAVGFFAPRIYVARTISKRLINFETQLPDTLGLWVNALRSGYSVLQALEAIAKDAGEPTAT